MKIEKEVTIIVDNMDIPYLQRVMDMDKDGKCHVIVDKTLFIFYPVHKLFKKNSDGKKYKLTRYVHEWDDPVELGEFDSIDEAKKAGRADMDKVFSGRWFTTMEEWKETSYGLKNEALHGDDDYIYVIAEKEVKNDI